MNFFELIKGFKDYSEENPISTGQVALWHTLVMLNNETQWKERFSVANSTLELYTGLSKEGIRKARNTLKQKGLIDFETRGTKATLYKIIPFKKSTTWSNSGRDSCLDSCRESGRVGCRESGTLIDYKTKDLKTKDIKKEKQAKEKSPEEVLSELGLSENLTNSILEFIENRKKNKDPMTNLAITKFVKNIKKLATDEQKQIELIDIAIINNWKNVFLPRENSFKNSPQKQNSGRPVQQVGEKYTVDDSTIPF